MRYIRSACIIIMILVFLAFTHVSFKYQGYAIAVDDYAAKKVEEFELNSTWTEINSWQLIGYAVSNDALVQVFCHLYSNSSAPIVLIKEPFSEWNQSMVSVGVGEEINITVTNGDLGLDSDVSSFFNIRIRRENIDEVARGLLSVVLLTRGWQKTTWPLVPGMMALLFLLVIRYRKNNYK